MEQTHLHRFLMNIHLSDRDIAQMPESLCNEFLDWLPESLKTKNLMLDPVPVPQHDETVILNRESQIPEENSDNTHVRLTQLFDAGITKRGMPVRVKLKQKVAKKLSREYVNNMEISATGTIVYNGQEHDKPSPLAAKINGSAANGWEYLEVKKNDQWVRLDELRQIWRKTND